MTVIPFPSRRRRAHLVRLSAAARRYKPASAAAYIDSFVEKHKQRLLSIGVDANIAENDAADLAAALYRGAGLRSLDGSAA